MALSRDAGGQVAAAEAVGGELELAGSRRPAVGCEVVGALPVGGCGRPCRGGPRGVEVGQQPGRIGRKQVMRILKKLVQSPGRAGMPARWSCA
jgi:hypothetical protein